jgi:hypothetical protein
VTGRHHNWMAIGSIVLLALGAVCPAIWRGEVIGSTVDLFGTVWFQWWIGHCIETATNPSFTDLMFHPLGKDIFGHTGNNFVDALVVQPLRWALGFPTYQPWFIFLVLLGNAWTFDRLIRDIVSDGRARWAATALWMINPFVLFEINNGRVTQAFLWFLPLALRHFLRIGGGGWRHAVLAGVFTALQAWTYWFLGFFMAVGFAWWAVLALWRRADERRALVRGWALAAATCGLMVAPFAIAMLMAAEAGHVPGIGDDPGGILDPPSVRGNNVARVLHGYLFVERVGQPMFATVTWGGGLLAALMQRGVRWRWGGLALVSLAFAIGPVWPSGPDESWVMPHYMALYRYVPFYARLWFPYRWIVLAMLAVAVALGSLVVAATSNRGRWIRLGLPVALVLGGTLEQVQIGSYPLVHHAMPIPAVIAELGARGGGIIDLPIGVAKVAQVWQTVHKQPTFGGMGENALVFWPDGHRARMAMPLIQSLRTVTRRPRLARMPTPVERWSIVAEGFRWVVLDRAMAEEMARVQSRGGTKAAAVDGVIRTTQRLIEILGAPVAVDGRVVIWDLTKGPVFEPPFTPTETSLGVGAWQSEKVRVFETDLPEIRTRKETR